MLAVAGYLWTRYVQLRGDLFKIVPSVVDLADGFFVLHGENRWMSNHHDRIYAASYGQPATPGRYRKRCLWPQTPVPGLYLTGADVSSLGIGGALMGGVFTTSSILWAASFPGIIKEALRS